MRPSCGSGRIELRIFGSPRAGAAPYRKVIFSNSSASEPAEVRVRDMINLPRLSIGICTLFISVSASAAPSQVDAEVTAAYHQYYSGDTPGAQAAFERLATARPGHLPARFGVLQVLFRRLGEE